MCFACTDLAGEWDDADPDLFDQRISRVKAAMAEEAGMSHEEDAVFDGGFKVPGSIFGRLFDYQKTGVPCLTHGLYSALSSWESLSPCLDILYMGLGACLSVGIGSSTEDARQPIAHLHSLPGRPSVQASSVGWRAPMGMLSCGPHQAGTLGQRSSRPVCCWQA